MAIKAQSYLNLYGDLSSIATAVCCTSSLHKEHLAMEFE